MESAQTPLNVPRAAKPGETEWDTGLCDTYALALMSVYPDLRFAVAGSESDGGWVPEHFLAHDDVYAYDITGPRTIDQIRKEFQVVELNQNPEDWVDVYGDNGNKQKFQEAAEIICGG